MYSRRSWLRLAGGACMALALAACGASPAGSTENPGEASSPPAASATSPAATGNGGLEGSRWRLVEYGPVDAPVAALPEPQVTISFEAGNRISGSAGCNSYGGAYQLDGDTFDAGEIASTLMACADVTIGQQETEFLAALDAATSLQQSGDELTMAYDGGRLRFARL